MCKGERERERERERQREREEGMEGDGDETRRQTDRGKSLLQIFFLPLNSYIYQNSNNKLNSWNMNAIF